jgi:tRNA(Arg) A34 adenosine deaminase TadA
MNIALDYAKKAIFKNEIPVAAIIVDEFGEIIAKAHNQTIKYNNPLKHAEIIVIEKALKKIPKQQNRLENCDMYVTLEPCSMCATAISYARIKRLYYATSDEKGGGVENGAKIFYHKTCNHRPEIISGILAEESQKLLKSFFSQKR